MPTACFMVVDSGEAFRSLRRYADATCPSNAGWHSAVAPLDRAPTVYTPDGCFAPLRGVVPNWDARWPHQCAACPYVFGPLDARQVNQEPIYRAGDGRELPQRNLPPGAMFDSPWMPPRWHGPDGLALTVILPFGPWTPETDTRAWWWHIDGPSSPPPGSNQQGPGWTRSGTPPNVTANPSINAVGRYHGWLRDGILTDPI